MLFHYVWAYGLGEIARSGEEAKVTLAALGALMAPFVVGFQLLWLLTGRGRRVRRFVGWDVIVVIPGMRRTSVRDVVRAYRHGRALRRESG